MPDFELLLYSALEYVADNSTAITAGTIIFSLICLVLFRRRKSLRSFFLLIMVLGPGLAIFATKYYGDSDQEFFPRDILEVMLHDAESDLDIFKVHIEQAIRVGAKRRSSADASLRQAQSRYRAFLEKMEKVPRRQRKKFLELRSQFKEELKHAEDTLGEIELD
ncbi:MAG: hypothetical protein V3U69_01535 [Bacteroidota bacterium]